MPSRRSILLEKFESIGKHVFWIRKDLEDMRSTIGQDNPKLVEAVDMYDALMVSFAELIMNLAAKI